MGGRITRRLISAGHHVIGFDSDARRVNDCGASAAASPAELAAQSDIILLSLPDSPAVESVVEGGDGLAANARAGMIVIDLSTASPASTIRLAGLFAD